MGGIFHSQDLIVKGEGSGHRGECQSASLALWRSDAVTFNMWLIPFESDGYTIFDTYSIYHDWRATDGTDEYAYKLAVYRQYSKLSDIATTNGIGELVANTTLSSGSLTGNRSVRNTSAMASPVILPQGSYWIAFHPYMITAKPKGVVSITISSGIDPITLGNTWVNESHMIALITPSGTLPPLLTILAAGVTSLAGTFASNVYSFWAGIFDARDAFP